MEPDATSLGWERLEGWLTPDRPDALRRQAARLARAAGGWNRIEADLRLLHDADALVARYARIDGRGWVLSPPAYQQTLAEERRAVLAALLEEAGDALDAFTVGRVRFWLTVRS